MGTESDADNLYGGSNAEQEATNRVVITQTRTVRLIGNGPPVELKFMVVDSRDTWIAELQQERKQEEQALESLKAHIGPLDDDEDESSEALRSLGEHEARLRRIQEYEERVHRSETARDVERIITQILEFARHGAGRQST